MMSKATQVLGVVLLWFGVGLLGSSTATAQTSPAAAPSERTPAVISVPRLVKFSGAVQDSGGNPRSGITGITFALYKDQSGGGALWLETQNVTLDAQGHYTVLLGANSAEGMTSELFSANEAQWLGVQPEGQTEQRVLLVSVPYALKAADAETLGGRPASSFVLAVPVANGSSSSGTQSGSAANAALPQAACATPPCNVVTAGGTPNFLSKFQDATTVQNSAIFESGGLVGIGNSSPTRTLDVSGEIRVGGGNIYMQRNLTDLAGRRNWAWGTETFNVGDVSLFVSTSNSSFPSSPVFTALSNGHMGVGLPTPTEALSVAGTIQSTTGGFMFPDATVQTTASLLTGVTAGSGLSGGGKSGSVTLSANFSSVQARITGTCSSGTAMGSIGADGSATCNTVSGGGGSLTLPFSGTGADSPPTVQGVFKVTDTTNGPANTSNSGPPDPTTIPSAVVGLTTGTGITAGVVGEATNSDGVGVVAISTAAVGDEVPVLVAWSQATSGDVSLIDGLASSPGTRGIDLQFAVTPSRGIIQASVGPNNSSTTVFSVDGSGSINTNANITANGQINAIGTIHSNTSITAPVKSFKIDDPLAPADKWLYHTSVESPDMLNFYNGVVVLDARGQAWVLMPDWFQALNRDFRYQLTAVGKPAPNLYVAREIKDNRFKISGGRPHGRISWQVTGIRHDAYANAHRTPVEQEKSPAERGKYMYPEGFGHPEGEAIGATSNGAAGIISAAAGQH